MNIMARISSALEKYSQNNEHLKAIKNEIAQY